MFTLLLFLACLEKLASIATIVAIERDWVIIIAEVNSISRQDVNASLRRLDLLSKLVAPFLISLLNKCSPTLSIWALLVISVASSPAEFHVTTRIYTNIPKLALRTTPTKEQRDALDETEMDNLASQTTAFPPPVWARSTTMSRLSWLTAALTPWIEYTRSPVFLASISNSILYWTVLSFGGQTVTYLLTIGFLPLEISVLRLASVVTELAGTWVAPIVMDRIGPVRAGLWFLLWQVFCVLAFAGPTVTSDAMAKSVGVALAAGITFKRVGLWGSDLAIQYIVQEVGAT